MQCRGPFVSLRSFHCPLLAPSASVGVSGNGLTQPIDELSCSNGLRSDDPQGGVGLMHASAVMGVRGNGLTQPVDELSCSNGFSNDDGSRKSIVVGSTGVLLLPLRLGLDSAFAAACRSFA